MKYLSDEINSNIISIVDQKFETVLVDTIDRFIEFFNTLTELREGFPDYDEKVMILNTENARKICDNINTQIDKHYKRNESLNFDNLFPELIDQLDNLLSVVEPVIKVEQSEARFKLLADDKNIIKLGKRIKIPVFKSQQLSVRLINPVLKVMKRQPIKLKYWDQNIPLRNVAIHYLRNRLLKKLSMVYEDVFKVLSEKSIDFWNYDENYDEEYISSFISGSSTNKVRTSVMNPETIISEFESLKDEIKKKSSIAIKQCTEELDIDSQKVG
ncbi:MAG: hypothetical protein OQK56_06425, partial [Ignavibacteriaceae bacterium]|nr:hypothetical protein [Ignavibacteriaceae bacterium]